MMKINEGRVGTLLCPRGYQTAWADDKPVCPPYAILREQIYPARIFLPCFAGVKSCLYCAHGTNVVKGKKWGNHGKQERGNNAETFPPSHLHTESPELHQEIHGAVAGVADRDCRGGVQPVRQSRPHHSALAAAG